MADIEAHRAEDPGDAAQHWKGIYFWGGAATVVVLAGLVLDIVAGNALGGDISRIPSTAAGRLQQYADSALLGLYNHDFLNLILQIVLLPAYWSLHAALRGVNRAWSGLALLLFAVGTTLFVAGNAALPMLELSRKFAAATEPQRAALAAAGEALLARGAHGSAGALLAFVLPTFASLVMASAMLAGDVFSRATAVLGIAGNALMLVYLFIVTFVQGAEKFAVALAMPGGLLVMAWMALFALRLFRLAGARPLI